MNSFITPAIRDQDSLILGEFFAVIIQSAPRVEIITASSGLIETIESIFQY